MGAEFVVDQFTDVGAALIIRNKKFRRRSLCRCDEFDDGNLEGHEA